MRNSDELPVCRKIDVLKEVEFSDFPALSQAVGRQPSGFQSRVPDLAAKAARAFSLMNRGRQIWKRPADSAGDGHGSPPFGGSVAAVLLSDLRVLLRQRNVLAV